MGPKRENILILRLSAAGDILQTLPAVELLRQEKPRARITWMVDDRFAPLLKNQSLVDEILIHPRKAWGEGLGSARLPWIAGEILLFAQALRHRGFDLALDFQGNLKSGVWSWLSGARLRVGFAQGHCKEANVLFNTVHVAPPEFRMHRVRKYIALLGGVGIHSSDVIAGYDVTPQARGIFEAFHKGAGGLPVAVLSPGTSAFGAYKQWSPERWGGLAARLRHEFGLLPVFPAGPGEQDLAERIATASDHALVVPTPPPNFAQLAAFIEGARIFIGVDSAPLHLAHLLGRPVVAIFGPTDTALYAPFHGQSEVLKPDLPCSPCPTRGCDDQRCLDGISVEDVAGRVGALMERTSLAASNLCQGEAE
jgi:heptosyltransferase-1